MRTSGFFIFMLLSGPVVKAGTDLPTKNITLVFHNRIGKNELVLDDSIKNILGDMIMVEKFKYYISNFSVTDQQGKIIVLPQSYFLVDESKPESKKIILTVPDISISSIHFLLGVDSIRNVSGIQSGALDPLHGMFWTWNSGYIMAQLEGTAETVPSPGHRFTFDVGGFRNGINVLKNISLPISNISFHELHIDADINKWFKANTELKITETPVCHGPGALALRIASNYSTMFTINSAQ